MIKISHECPISLLGQSREFNDYDYALVHLFEQLPEYYNFFVKSLEMGREVILDTSLFELGESFDWKKYAEWIRKLKPTYYIVPDVIADSANTMANASIWMDEWNNIQTPPECKAIGVVQGNTIDEVIDCYNRMHNLQVDKIAFTFRGELYENLCPHPNKYFSWMMGRVTLMSMLLDQGVIDPSIPHHLLGCALPGEGKFYKDPAFSWIDSMDTSNPIVHTIKDVMYQENWGLNDKESQKLFTMIRTKIEEIDERLLEHNLSTFRDLWN